MVALRTYLAGRLQPFPEVLRFPPNAHHRILYWCLLRVDTRRWFCGPPKVSKQPWVEYGYSSVDSHLAQPDLPACASVVSERKVTRRLPHLATTMEAMQVGIPRLPGYTVGQCTYGTPIMEPPAQRSATPERIAETDPHRDVSFAAGPANQSRPAHTAIRIRNGTKEHPP